MKLRNNLNNLSQKLDESIMDFSVLIDSDLEDDIAPYWDHRASLDVALEREKDYNRKLMLLEGNSLAFLYNVAASSISIDSIYKLQHALLGRMKRSRK